MGVCGSLYVSAEFSALIFYAQFGNVIDVSFSFCTRSQSYYETIFLDRDIPFANTCLKEYKNVTIEKDKQKKTAQNCIKKKFPITKLNLKKKEDKNENKNANIKKVR